MGEDEDATHRALSHYLDLIAAIIESRSGQVMHYAGDALLAQFAAVFEAVASSVAIQNELQSQNAALPDERQVRFRIGVNLGDVIPVRAYRIFERDPESTSPTPHQTNSGVPVIPQPFGKPSVSVKPFDDIGAEAEQERLADAFTNGIIVSLIRIPGLVLVGDESPSMVKSKQMTLDEIGHRFGVRYVLKGGVRKIGGRVVFMRLGVSEVHQHPILSTIIERLNSFKKSHTVTHSAGPKLRDAQLILEGIDKNRNLRSGVAVVLFPLA